MGSSFYCNSVAVNNAVSDINSVISNLSLLSSDIKSATNQIVSATGFNEYIGGITNDTFSGYIEECGAAAYQLCNNIRQIQISCLAYSEDKVAINKFFDGLSTTDLKFLDLTPIDKYISLDRKAMMKLKGFGASALTFGAGFLEGVLDFGETGADLVTLGATAIGSIFTKGHDLLTGDNLTQRMWAETRAKVSEKVVESAFDKFYATTPAGKWMKDNAYYFDTVRGIGKGVGYSTAMIGFSVATGGLASGGGLASIGAKGTVSAARLASTAGLLGFANGTEESWADGATLKKGLAYGVAAGTWEAAQWAVGAKINQFGGFGDKIAKTLGGKTMQGVFSRAGLDTVDSGLEGFVQPALTMIYKDYGGSNFVENYTTAFEQAGGWENVKQQAAIGGLMSFGSEMKDARKILVPAKDADIVMGTGVKVDADSAETGALRTPVDPVNKGVISSEAATIRPDADISSNALKSSGSASAGVKNSPDLPSKVDVTPNRVDTGSSVKVNADSTPNRVDTGSSSRPVTPAPKADTGSSVKVNADSTPSRVDTGSSSRPVTSAPKADTGSSVKVNADSTPSRVDTGSSSRPVTPSPADTGSNIMPDINTSKSMANASASVFKPGDASDSAAAKAASSLATLKNSDSSFKGDTSGSAYRNTMDMAATPNPKSSTANVVTGAAGLSEIGGAAAIMKNADSSSSSTSHMNVGTDSSTHMNVSTSKNMEIGSSTTSASSLQLSTANRNVEVSTNYGKEINSKSNTSFSSSSKDISSHASFSAKDVEGDLGKFASADAGGTKSSRTLGQLNADMDKMGTSLMKKQANLDEAKANLTNYRKQNGIDINDTSRKISVDEKKLINKVNSAQKAYDNQYSRLVNKQKQYVDGAKEAPGAVGTEGKKKLINSPDGGFVDGRPEFTDASAKVEGQIDGSALKKVLDAEEGTSGGTGSKKSLVDSDANAKTGPSEEMTFTNKDTYDSVAERLDKAVEDGKLTREQADKMFDKVEEKLHLGDKDRIAELQKENQQYEHYKQENIDEKKLLVEQDGAKVESVKGHDRAVSQLDEHIAANNAEIERLKKGVDSAPESYKVGGQETVPTADVVPEKLDADVPVSAVSPEITSDNDVNVKPTSTDTEMTFTNKDTYDSVAERLDKAVEDGKLTREQADKMFDEVEEKLHLGDKDRIAELQKENQQYENFKQANVDEKKLLVEQDGAKVESVKGHDRAVSQLDEHIAANNAEIERLQKGVDSAPESYKVGGQETAPTADVAIPKLDTEAAPKSTRTLGQLNADMDKMGTSLMRKQANLDDAKVNLDNHRKQNGIDIDDTSRKISVDEKKLINKVNSAQKAYDNQYSRLVDKQKQYVDGAKNTPGAVGTESKMKVINSPDGGLLDTRPSITDASAKVEGQIDGSSLRKLPIDGDANVKAASDKLETDVPAAPTVNRPEVETNNAVDSKTAAGKEAIDLIMDKKQAVSDAKTEIEQYYAKEGIDPNNPNRVVTETEKALIDKLNEASSSLYDTKVSSGKDVLDLLMDKRQAVKDAELELDRYRESADIDNPYRKISDTETKLMENLDNAQKEYREANKINDAVSEKASSDVVDAVLDKKKALQDAKDELTNYYAKEGINPDNPYRISTEAENELKANIDKAAAEYRNIHDNASSRVGDSGFRIPEKDIDVEVPASPTIKPEAEKTVSPTIEPEAKEPISPELKPDTTAKTDNDLLDDRKRYTDYKLLNEIYNRMNDANLDLEGYRKANGIDVNDPTRVIGDAEQTLIQRADLAKQAYETRKAYDDYRLAVLGDGGSRGMELMYNSEVSSVDLLKDYYKANDAYEQFTKTGLYAETKDFDLVDYDREIANQAKNDLERYKVANGIDPNDTTRVVGDVERMLQQKSDLARDVYQAEKDLADYKFKNPKDDGYIELLDKAVDARSAYDDFVTPKAEGDIVTPEVAEAVHIPEPIEANVKEPIIPTDESSRIENKSDTGAEPPVPEVEKLTEDIKTKEKEEIDLGKQVEEQKSVETERIEKDISEQEVKIDESKVKSVGDVPPVGAEGKENVEVKDKHFEKAGDIPEPIDTDVKEPIIPTDESSRIENKSDTGAEPPVPEVEKLTEEIKTKEKEEIDLGKQVEEQKSVETERIEKDISEQEVKTDEIKPNESEPVLAEGITKENSDQKIEVEKPVDNQEINNNMEPVDPIPAEPAVATSKSIEIDSFDSKHMDLKEIRELQADLDNGLADYKRRNGIGDDYKTQPGSTLYNMEKSARLLDERYEAHKALREFQESHDPFLTSAKEQELMFKARQADNKWKFGGESSIEWLDPDSIEMKKFYEERAILLNEDSNLTRLEIEKGTVGETLSSEQLARQAEVNKRLDELNKTFLNGTKDGTLSRPVIEGDQMEIYYKNQLDRSKIDLEEYRNNNGTLMLENKETMVKLEQERYDAYKESIEYVDSDSHVTAKSLELARKSREAVERFERFINDGVKPEGDLQEMFDTPEAHQYFEKRAQLLNDYRDATSLYEKSVEGSPERAKLFDDCVKAQKALDDLGDIDLSKGKSLSPAEDLSPVGPESKSDVEVKDKHFEKAEDLPPVGAEGKSEVEVKDKHFEKAGDIPPVGAEGKSEVEVKDKHLKPAEDLPPVGVEGKENVEVKDKHFEEAGDLSSKSVDTYESTVFDESKLKGLTAEERLNTLLDSDNVPLEVLEKTKADMRSYSDEYRSIGAEKMGLYDQAITKRIESIKSGSQIDTSVTKYDDIHLKSMSPEDRIKTLLGADDVPLEVLEKTRSDMRGLTDLTGGEYKNLGSEKLASYDEQLTKKIEALRNSDGGATKKTEVELTGKNNNDVAAQDAETKDLVDGHKKSEAEYAEQFKKDLAAQDAETKDLVDVHKKSEAEYAEQFKKDLAAQDAEIKDLADGHKKSEADLAKKVEEIRSVEAEKIAENAKAASAKENITTEAINDSSSTSHKQAGDINLTSVSNDAEMEAALFKRNSLANNEVRDKEFISKYLDAKKRGESFGMYTDPANAGKVDYERVVSETFNDGGSGTQISGTRREYSIDELRGRGEHDYRITLRNSPDITTNEAIAFDKALVSEAQNRNLNLRAKNYWESDAVILYCDKDNLLGTVKLLEDLKDASKYGDVVSNATKHFGPTQPFSATVGDDGYYGISMAHSEPQYGQTSKIVSSTYGNSGSTFNGYVDSTMDQAYSSLLKKYGGDATKITTDEMYSEVVRQHKEYMLGADGDSSDIPLWMNRRNYNDYKQVESALGLADKDFTVKSTSNSSVDISSAREDVKLGAAAKSNTDASGMNPLKQAEDMSPVGVNGAKADSDVKVSVKEAEADLDAYRKANGINPDDSNRVRSDAEQALMDRVDKAKTDAKLETDASGKNLLREAGDLDDGRLETAARPETDTSGKNPLKQAGDLDEGRLETAARSETDTSGKNLLKQAGDLDEGRLETAARPETDTSGKNPLKQAGDLEGRPLVEAEGKAKTDLEAANIKKETNLNLGENALKNNDTSKLIVDSNGNTIKVSTSTDIDGRPSRTTFVMDADGNILSSITKAYDSGGDLVVHERLTDAGIAARNNNTYKYEDIAKIEDSIEGHMPVHHDVDSSKISLKEAEAELDDYRKANGIDPDDSNRVKSAAELALIDRVEKAKADVDSSKISLKEAEAELDGYRKANGIDPNDPNRVKSDAEQALIDRVEKAKMDNKSREDFFQKKPEVPISDNSQRPYEHIDTRAQQQMIIDTNARIKRDGHAVIQVTSTKDLTSRIFDGIDDLSKVEVRIEGGFTDLDGNYKPKYAKERYYDRITYTGYEAADILRRLEGLESRIDMSLPPTERARQIYELVSSEYSYSFHSLDVEGGHKVSASLRGLTSNNMLGEEGLVCAGYAQTYKELCNRAGLECEYISGTGYTNSGSGRHAWNVVKGTDGEMIPVDTTWRSSGGDWFGRSAEFQATHVADADEIYVDYSPKVVAPPQDPTISHVVKTMNDVHGKGSGTYGIVGYLASGDSSYITRTDCARQMISSVPTSTLESYLKNIDSEARTSAIMDYVKYQLNSKYGADVGKKQFDAFLKTRNFDYITGQGNARSFARKWLTDTDIFSYVLVGY